MTLDEIYETMDDRTKKWFQHHRGKKILMVPFEVSGTPHIAEIISINVGTLDADNVLRNPERGENPIFNVRVKLIRERCLDYARGIEKMSRGTNKIDPMITIATDGMSWGRLRPFMYDDNGHKRFIYFGNVSKPPIELNVADREIILQAITTMVQGL